MASPEKNTLKTHQSAFNAFDLGQYHLGGEPSRFAWQHMPALFPHLTVNHHNTRQIPVALDKKVGNWQVMHGEISQSLDDYVAGEARIDSVMVVHRGNIVYQRYKSHTALDRHIVWSVTKVMVGAALARLEAAGQVDMQRPVATFLPELKNSGWSKVALQDVADMASGVDCRDSDDYDNLNSCVRMVDVYFGLTEGPQQAQKNVSQMLSAMPSYRTPGEETEYTSANTLVLGQVIEKVTGKPLNQALSELIWQPAGAEADALLISNKFGDGYAGGGISARLADVARFGMLYTRSPQNDLEGFAQHIQRLKDAQRPLFSEPMHKNLQRLFDGDAPVHSRWQWDLIWADGDLYKDGYSGQGIYVSPTRDLVMAWFGTADKQFRKHRLLPIARQLSVSELFQPAREAQTP